MKDIFDLLTEDHDRIKSLIIEIGTTVDGDLKKRDRLFTELRLELGIHSHYEDNVAFPKMRRELDRDVAYSVEQEEEEHEQIEYMVSLLEMLDSRSEEWMDTVARLAFLFERHAQNEEIIFFPQAREQLQPDIPLNLADQYYEQRRHIRKKIKAA